MQTWCQTGSVEPLGRCKQTEAVSAEKEDHADMEKVGTPEDVLLIQYFAALAFPAEGRQNKARQTAEY